MHGSSCGCCWAADLLATDSGACTHVMDASVDAPGYTVHLSSGSRRGQSFIVGDGHPVPNEGEVHLNFDASVGDGSVAPIQSSFQVAEIHERVWDLRSRIPLRLY